MHARYHWWLRQKGYQPNTDVLQYVLQLYRGISQLPRYQADAGASFVFWQPHTSVFGDASMWGEALVPKFTVTFSCQVFQNSLFLVPCMYLRWRCDRYSPERTLVVPQASMDILENRFAPPPLLLLPIDQDPPFPPAFPWALPDPRAGGHYLLHVRAVNTLGPSLASYTQAQANWVPLRTVRMQGVPGCLSRYFAALASQAQPPHGNRTGCRTVVKGGGLARMPERGKQLHAC